MLIRKLAHPRPPVSKRARRGRSYGAEVLAPLVKVWDIFDYPCGQRLAPAMRENLDGLRRRGTIRCGADVSEKLRRMSAQDDGSAAGA